MEAPTCDDYKAPGKYMIDAAGATAMNTQNIAALPAGIAQALTDPALPPIKVDASVTVEVEAPTIVGMALENGHLADIADDISTLATDIGDAVPVPPSAAAIGAQIPLITNFALEDNGVLDDIHQAIEAINIPIPPSADAIGTAVGQHVAIPDPPTAEAIGIAVGDHVAVPTADAIGAAVGGAVPSAAAIGAAVGGAVPSAAAIGAAVPLIGGFALESTMQSILQILTDCWDPILHSLRTHNPPS